MSNQVLNSAKGTIKLKVMKHLVIILILALIAPTTWAQEVAFKTLAAQGTCIVQRGDNPDEYVPISTGIKIFNNDKIIITGDNSYVGLVGVNGNAIEVTKGGVYNARDLLSESHSASTGLAKKYLQLLVDDMSKSQDRTAENMIYTGAVSRSTSTESIALFLPESTKVIKSSATVQWFHREKASSYTVRIRNLYEEVIFEKQTSAEEITLDFNVLDMNPGEVYEFEVRETQRPARTSNKVTFKVPNRSELAQIDTELERLSLEIPRNTAIGDMVIATYYEDHGLYLNAIPYYKSAIDKEPDIVEYLNAYNTFLEKIGLGGMANK
jgi:hypothetical protein